MTPGANLLPPRYEEQRLIGRGGMGEIHLAHDRELDRPVAVKVLDEAVAERADLRERFRREALTAARLSGEPHVVTIFDVGEHEGRPFIVMEYLPGRTLGERARDRPPTRERALDWLRQAATALDAAHAKGVVHRDVKPANLIFDARGTLNVVDFGIARVVDETSGMTAPGTLLGTAGYLAPEQAQGREATAASDRYALGVVAYELLTGGRPFERGSATAEAAAHIHEPVPPASHRGVGLPPAVDAVFERALAKGPEARFPTATSFVDALARALVGEETAATRVAGPPPGEVRPAAARTSRRTPVLVAAALGAAALLGGGVGAALLLDGDDPVDRQRPAREARTVTEEVTVEGEATTVVQTVTEAPKTEEPPPAGQDLSPEEAAALNDEAFTSHMQAGDYAGALPLLERAVPALQGTYSDGFRYEAYAEYNLGKTLAELDRCEEALPHLERSGELQGELEPIVAAKRQCGA
ncbi:MAG TPA: serine/threonine-protein kinase [Gaiellaceae bacterium]|nr:serine/threonine-protein kinase [Gaiellaceae bacterium]